MHASDDLSDVLGTTPSSGKKAPKKSAAKKAATKPSKAVVTKPNGKASAKGAKKAAPAAKPAKPAKKARVKVAGDESTVQPDDKVVIAAVKKLKEETMASTFAHSLKVHMRTIRAQLIRLSEDKANGIKMVKKGFNWFVSPK